MPDMHHDYCIDTFTTVDQSYFHLKLFPQETIHQLNGRNDYYYKKYFFCNFISENKTIHVYIIKY